MANIVFTNNFSSSPLVLNKGEIVIEPHESKGVPLANYSFSVPSQAIITNNGNEYSPARYETDEDTGEPVLISPEKQASQDIVVSKEGMKVSVPPTVTLILSSGDYVVEVVA